MTTAHFQDCQATLEGGILTLATRRVQRRFRWDHGRLTTLSLADPDRSRTWNMAADAPDCAIFGIDGAAAPGSADFKAEVLPETPMLQAHLRVHVSARIAGLEILRCFRLYPGCPAIACDFFLRGATPPADPAKPTPSSILERLATAPRHTRQTAVRFYAHTDTQNNLVESRSILPYHTDVPLVGNVLLISDLLDDAGIFVLKEAPPGAEQVAWPGHDFASNWDSVRVVGIGMTPADLHPENWTRAYGVVTGVAGASEEELRLALRNYQHRLRVHKPGRDHMVMLNTWGDRSADKRIGEAFCLAEIEAGARLGVTHFQLDYGWHRGSPEAGNAPGNANELASIWRHPDYWQVHPTRFPRGLEPVMEAARAAGIEMSLWFNPSHVNSHERWKEDADVLIAAHRRYGIRTFKIDGVELPDKRADANLRAMLDRIVEATGGEAVFNLDITAGQRFGYHYFNEYGPYWTENRYTDWKNYYPHRTLRNLWMLSRYVPPQTLQMEYLNRWRNAEKYGDDPLAPARVPFDYCFAITMAAQPMSFFEASSLPNEAFAIAPLIRQYRRHQQQIHAHPIFPIGEEPSGTGWTGFQSCGEVEGYFLIYRERNDRHEAQLATLGLAGRRLRCELIAGHGTGFESAVDDEGLLRLSLPAPWTFGLWRYHVVA